MAANARTASYSYQENIPLCHVYLDISQDPIIGINQSRNKFWSRVEQSYKSSRAPDMTEVRNKRSVQSRMGLILAAISKLKACIQQVEQLHPSGASDVDIIIRAKELMKHDSNFKKGFKFDHVWSIMKDMEKFAASSNHLRSTIQRSIEFFDSQQSDTQATDSPKSASPGLSPFEINLSDENIGEQNRKMLDLTRFQEENKILVIDLNSIQDPSLRENFKAEQSRILSEREERKRARDSLDYGKYFGDIGGSGSSLPPF
ncbi:uncharacterized protein [Primulina eburnea]|uniref:uncharacterized protein n=1 Tax=Primulina eburnea TaxID=1245227 RepID=UPI003C6BF098